MARSARKKTSPLKRWGIVFMTLILIGLLLFNPWSLAQYARFLSVSTPPLHRADAIVVLAGDWGIRETAGATLLKDDFAPYLIMSGGGTMFGKQQSHWMKQYVIAQGIPAHRIHEESRSQSTIDNAKYSLALLHQLGASSAIIVTSQYHLRRTQYTFSHFNTGDSTIDLQFYGSKDGIDRSEWFKHYEDTQTILSEWVRLILYHLILR